MSHLSKKFFKILAWAVTSLKIASTSNKIELWVFSTGFSTGFFDTVFSMSRTPLEHSWSFRFQTKIMKFHGIQPSDDSYQNSGKLVKRSWIEFASFEKFNPCGSKSTSKTSVHYFAVDVWNFTAVARFFTLKASSFSELLWINGAILAGIILDSTTQSPSGWTVPNNCLNPTCPFIETIAWSVLASESCF